MQTTRNGWVLLTKALVSLGAVCGLHLLVFTWGQRTAPTELAHKALPVSVVYCYVGVSLALGGIMFYCARRWGQRTRWGRFCFSAVVVVSFLLSPFPAVWVAWNYGRKAMTLVQIPVAAIAAGWQFAGLAYLFRSRHRKLRRHPHYREE